MMKKAMMTVLGAALLLSSCGSYTATGAYTGSQFGNVIGSAVGGINGGWRGHEVGSIVGTVGGAVAGAAIGSAVERSQQRKYENRQQQTSQRTASKNSKVRRGSSYDQSGYDPQGRGDDRIDFMGQGYASAPLQIRNIQILEDHRDGALTRGEELTVIFEVYNNRNYPVRDIHPLIEEATGNKHIHISKGLRIDRIDGHQGVRYTARVMADRGLRNGQIVLRIGVAEGQQVVQSEIYEYQVPTTKGLR